MQKPAHLAQAPGLRQVLPLPYGLVTRGRRRPLQFLVDGWRRFGDVFRYQSGPWVFHLVSHPDYVKHVLQDHYKNYPRSRFYNLIKLALGEGLVTSEGDFWRRQRRMAQPAFQRQRVQSFAGVMVRLTEAMLERWHPWMQKQQPVNISAEMMRLALGIAGETLFSTDVSDETDVMGGATTAAIEYMNFRINHFFAMPLPVPTPRNLRFRRAMRDLDRYVYQLIAERRRSNGDRGDLLSMIMKARDEDTDELMNDRQLRDEIVTFLGAGHETTAVALAWTWYLLSQHPDIDRRMRQEIDSVLGGRSPTIDDVPRLSYTRMVFEESMRIYPPVWAMSRNVLADDTIGGFHIPAGSIVVVSQYVTHRHPEFWDNPEGFDPERFTPERSAQRHRGAYFPFAIGPHQCIGNEFALMEAVLVLATVAQRYRLCLLPGYRVEPDPIFTLRQRPSVLMTLKPARS